MTLNGLPAIDHAEAELRRVAIAALSGPRIDGVPMTARVAASPDPRGGWLTFANGAALALDRLDGAPLRFDPADATGAVALLERAEPLVAVIEAALGVTLDPRELVADAPDGMVLTIDHGDRARLRLSLPRDLSLLPAPADFAPELLAHVDLTVSLRIDGPRIAPHDAAALVPGDLVLLGPGPLQAKLAAGGRTATGTLDPATRMFRVAQAFGAA